MNWAVILFWIVLGELFCCVVMALVANHLTCKKRHQLIQRWAISGDALLAMDEFDAVTYMEHHKALMWFHNPKKLYGPLIQGVWYTDVQQNYSEFWWKCYNEIYLKAPKTTQRIINKYLSAYGLMGILTTLGYDLDYLLLVTDPPPKFSMVDGAEEYEQIMAMQEMGL